jgi:hypothetical protein
MSTCSEPANQAIYQRLLDRADHNKQMATQYKAVADALLTYDSDLFWCYQNMGDDMIYFITDENTLDGCSLEIAQYIFQQVHTLSSKNTCDSCGTVPRCYCGYP